MSETGNLKLKKHDNPETSEEKFDVDNYLNGNWDKIDENAEKTNNQILQLETEKAKLEKELKEAQEDIYQNSIRGQASGEYIHVEDSSGARCKIGISGNSEQETRSGKNFLELMEGTYSNNGVTAVVKDGVVTLNGTATAISFVGINLLKSLELTNNKTYHLSAFNEKTAGDSTNYCSLRINQDNIQVLFNKTNANGSITTNLKISYITIRTQTGITYNNFVVKPQLEIGNGTDTWEQGGASPSLDYPSQVKAVGDNVNLFDKDKFNNFTNNLQYIELTLKSNTKYTMCSNIPKGTGGCNLFAYKKGETASSSSNFVANGENRTVTTGDDGIIIIAYRNYNASLSDDPKNDYKYKLVEGTEVGEYSPYGQGSVKVTKCNKNLANIEKFNIAGGTGTTYPKTIQGLKENTEYTISFYKSRIVGATISNTAIHGCRKMHFYHNEEKLSEYTYDSPVSGFSSGNKKFEIKITTPAKCNKVICYFDNANGDNNINTTVYDIQLEEGTATNYEKHQEQSYIMPVQQPMRSIGDIRDTFIKKENKWYERHYVQRLILNGTEGWNYDKNNNRFYFAKAGNKGSGYIMSSHYLRGDTTKQNNTCEIWSSAILFRDERFTEREDFKNMIKAKYNEGIPVYVDYVSITPTDIECTEEQSQILEELNNARTYKNVTNITTDSKAIIDLDYAKDLETQNQKMQNEIDEIKQLLSTTQTSALLLDNLQKDVESEVE